MSIFRATILDLSGQTVIAPDVNVHFLKERSRTVGVALKIDAAAGAKLKTRGKYRIAIEDGRTGEFVVDQIQYQPDGTVLARLTLQQTERSPGMFDPFED